MLTMKSFIDFERDVLAGGKKIFPLKENWDMFRPFLNEPKVEYSLARCLGFKNAEEWKRELEEDEGEYAPWTYTRSDYWYMKITDCIHEDKEYRLEEKLLFEKMFGEDADIKDDGLWDDLFETDARSELDYRYYEKYSPKKGEIDWYRWIHGCFFIAPFVATLLKTAIKDAEGILILTSETHSVAAFIKNNVLYFADLLVEWESVKDLEAFMGELTEVKFLARNVDMNESSVA
ncbi:hypothetical protein QFZ81_000997 [Paenibacillus sp. V4I9]|uniref:hypothetical protein n=1 Tax=Paenibacillus sp. V4I9 TaxID=3042308 RepID=UPI002781085A|nr:hypothetical protein [Paenibacillus sp. V4I9]MDQ0885909.1 hypothetical protein [Paenibacillus sp. V4I9]